MSQNPLTQVSITLGAPVDGVVPVAIGPLTLYFQMADVKAVWLDRDERVLRAFLLGQIAVVLQQAGVNPTTATNAQIKTAVEAKTYWV